jgi:thiol-disulfide isomerase/thioredoxin
MMVKMKTRLLWMFGFLLATCSGRAADEPKMFSSGLTFEAALKQAAAQKKIVFIDFYTTWCGPCKMLDRTTWQDPAVVSLLTEKTIPLKVDAEKETALAERYKIDAYPTLLLVKPDGSVLDRLVGYRDAPTFTTEFNATLAGKTALTRAQEAVAATAKEDFHSQVQARYKLADTLAQQGKPADALKEYLWLFDDGMIREPSFVGVRGSFLLSSIATLGRDYPPALAALRERRDAAKARLENGAGDSAAAMDFAGLNRALGQEQSTLEVFEKLPASSPARQTLGRFVFDQLLASRRYAEAAAAQPADDFMKKFDRIADQVWGQGPATLNPEMRQRMQLLYVENAAKEIEALAGAGRLDDAGRLLKRVRSLDDSEPTRAVLRKHLDRASQSKLADF